MAPVILSLHRSLPMLRAQLRAPLGSGPGPHSDRGPHSNRMGCYGGSSATANGPTTMKSPPPSTKGITTMKTILEALPDVNTTTSGVTVVWVLSNEPMDRRRLGEYPDELFTEKTPLQFIKRFQDQLSEISKSIQERNKTMLLPYPYLDPNQIENSVSI